jgi:hypothetical protein
VKIKGRTQIYATKNDLIRGLTAVEETMRIKYVLDGITQDPNRGYLLSILNHKELGVNKSGQYTSGIGFFIFDKEDIVYADKTFSFIGKSKYYLNQILNPDSIVFFPGGVYRIDVLNQILHPFSIVCFPGILNKDILIMGEISTVSETKKSDELYKLFSRTLVKGFKKIKGYYIGEEALDLYKSGYRLTMAVQSPKEYDLVID